MKTKIKKIILGVLISIFAFSCSGLTAKEKYERGDYLGALQSTADELNSNKNIIPMEIENEIKFRINEIENRYKVQINNLDERNNSFAYFNLWNMGHIIEKNPVLQKYTDFLIRNDNFKNLNSSVESMKKYVNYDINNRLSQLDELINRFKAANVRNSSYSTIYESFARYGADIYLDKAKSFENLNKLEEARDWYYKGSKIIEDFTSNYRNALEKYNTLKTEIDLRFANKLFEEAISYYNSNNFEMSKKRFEDARRIYANYRINNYVNQIDTFLSDINRRVALNEASKNFDEGKRYYNSKNYSYAKTRFENAKKVFNYYGNYTLVREIDVYLENIKFKEAILEADKYFNEGERYYSNQRYRYAKDSFEKALKIYSTYNEGKNISRIKVYLENISIKLNNEFKPDNNNLGNRYFNSALELFKKAENTYNFDDSNYYYKKALEEFKMALKYVNDYRKENEIKRYIENIESKLNYIPNNKIDNHIKFSRYRLEGLNLLTMGDSMINKKDALYYYNLALKNFKNALNYVSNNKEKDEINKYIKETDTKIFNNSITSYEQALKKAKELILIGDSKIKVEETNYYYSEAVKYLKLALNLTDNYDKRYEANNLINDLNKKIIK